MSDSKQAARDQTAHQLNIRKADADALKKQGDDSAKRRGKSFEPSQLKFPSPGEETRIHDAGEESRERRKHVTENIADSYRNSSSWRSTRINYGVNWKTRHFEGYGLRPLFLSFVTFWQMSLSRTSGWYGSDWVHNHLYTVNCSLLWCCQTLYCSLFFPFLFSNLLFMMSSCFMLLWRSIAINNAWSRWVVI